MDTEVHIQGMLHAKSYVLFTIWTIELLITCTRKKINEVISDYVYELENNIIYTIELKTVAYLS